MPEPAPWWHPDRHADRRPILLARNRIELAMRGYFADEDFVLVDPPGLQVSPGNETHLDAFATSLIGEDGAEVPRYLHTSPEFSMKKLLAAGETRIASFGHVWRNRERTATHHPEFSLLEWYRARAPYTSVMDDCVALIRLAAETAHATALRFKGRTADPFATAERISVADAFRAHAGIDLLATIPREGPPEGEALAAQMLARGIPVPADYTWSYLFTRVLSDHVEPALGNGRITILDRYPSSRPRSLAGLPTIRASPSASRSTRAASSSPTASANSSIRRSSGDGSRQKWTRRRGSMASAIRSTRTSSRPCH